MKDKFILGFCFALLTAGGFASGYLLGSAQQTKPISTAKNTDDENISSDSTTYDINDVIGIYHTNNWNHAERTLTLNADKTCKLPFNTDEPCTWKLDSNKISFNYKYAAETTIVNKGLLYGDTFFEKMD